MSAVSSTSQQLNCFCYQLIVNGYSWERGVGWALSSLRSLLLRTLNPLIARSRGQSPITYHVGQRLLADYLAAAGQGELLGDDTTENFGAA